VTWSASSAAPFALSPASGTLAPGASTPMTVSLDRANLAEGSSPAAVVTFSGDAGQSVPLSVTASVDRPPTISNLDGPSVVCQRATFGAATVTFWESNVSATITDESGGTATFTITGPGGRSGSSSAPFDSSWFGMANNLPDGDTIATSANGTWNWTISATDNRSNTSTTSGSLSVTCF